MRRFQFNLREILEIGSKTREWIVGPKQVPSLGRARIALAGISEAKEGFRFVRQQPRMSQILACTEGEGRIWVENRWRPCPAGTAYVTPPGQPHAYHAIRGKPWKLVWITFEQSHPLLRHRTVERLSGNPLPLREAFWGLYREMNGLRDPALLRLWTELLSAEAARWVSGKWSDPRFHALWERVDSSLQEDWSLERLAQGAGLGIEVLRRRCREIWGRSPVAHVTYLRMQRAALLLRSSNVTVEEVSARVGYENPFAFSTAFRRIMGVAPSRF